ncbi:TPR-like protein [Myriangium duriaei CBS 260.36]|uniref:TPR-like protein n=1 Tax=Myriangium duriaei CBS 260.36 TaxID=1168546 RepID=A0A9P4JCM2_9PEZI|nr:TPR-like protein [Myriangium duriaei CBS 260.36]
MEDNFVHPHGDRSTKTKKPPAQPAATNNICGYCRKLYRKIARIYFRRWLKDHDSAASHQARPSLEVLYEGPSTEIDVVAVHGLGSNVDWAWTWKNGNHHVHWLKDPNMLPSVIPNARIIGYNYVSRWHKDAPKTRLRLLGENLIHSLHEFRQGNRDRPIVFLGHSLGGLVITYALLHAERIDDFQYLTHTTVGFVALGTPFRGTRMQSLADRLARLMILAGSSRTILRDLSLDNDTLWETLQDFCRLERKLNLPIVCFFELLRTTFGRRFNIPGALKGMVVDEKSASMESWRSLSLNSDHVRINKFSSPSDPSFASVATQIRIMCDKGKELIEERRETKMQCATHFLVPFGRDKDFVGRHPIMDQLMQRVPPSAEEDNCQQTIIEGLGGVGKTAIAIELVYRIRKQYPRCSIFWVSTVDTTSFENAYREIGKKLHITTSGKDKIDIKMLVKDALSQHPKEWLLVIDNADDQQMLFNDPNLRRYLPWSYRGSILFTSRTHDTASHLDIATRNIARVTDFTRREAVQFLEKNLKTAQFSDQQSTSDLLDLLSDLPLALKQAAAYMKQKDVTTTEYLRFCSACDTEMIRFLSGAFPDRMRGGEDARTRNSFITTWLISFRHIDRDYPRAAQCLKQISLLGEKNIPRECFMIDGGTENDENEPGDLYEVDELELEDSIATLKAYSFVTQQVGQNSYDVHRLVRLAVRTWLSREKNLSMCIRSTTQVLHRIFPRPQESNQNVWIGLLHHAEQLMSFPIVQNEKGSQLLNHLCEGNHMLGRYPKAEYWCRKKLDHSIALFGAQHPETISSMVTLIDTLQLQFKVEEAQSILCDAFPIHMMASASNHNTAFLYLTRLGSTLSAQMRHHQAKTLLENSLEFLRRTMGKEHPDTLSTMYILGRILQEGGHWQKSESVLKDMLDANSRVSGADHKNMLHSMVVLGESLLYQKKYGEAESVLQDTLALQRKGLNRDDPSLLKTISNLGHVLFLQGKREAADMTLRIGLEQCERMLGTEHPLALSCMAGFASMLSEQEYYQEAELLLRSVHAQQIKALPPDNPTTMSTLQRLAHALWGQGRDEEAELLIKNILILKLKCFNGENSAIGSNLAWVLRYRAKHPTTVTMYHDRLTSLRLELGAEHPDVIDCQFRLAYLLMQHSRFDEAETHCREALALRTKLFGPEDSLVVQSWEKLGNLLQFAGKYDKAEQVWREAIMLRTKLFGAENPDTIRARNELAEVLWSQGRNDETELILRDVFSLRLKVLGAEHPDTVSSALHLKELSQDQINTKKADAIVTVVEKLV